LIEEGLRNSFVRNYVQLNLPVGPEFTPCDQITKMVGAEVAFELFKAMAGNIRPEMQGYMHVYTTDKHGSVRVDLVPHPPDSCLGWCSALGPRRTEYHITTNVEEWLHVHTIHDS
jgi:hypothetical protein